MKAIIFDVEHGFCAMLLANNGNVMLIDVGINSTTGFRPSELLKQMKIGSVEYLILSNYDEDHLCDLPNFRGRNAVASINKFRVNKSIPIEKLRSLKLKNGSLGNGISALLKLRENSNPAEVGPNLEGIKYRVFENSYPTFDDTNNLSLLTFVQAGSFTFCFTGDLEVAGWERILQNDEVQKWLKSTNVFIASHHGRQSGYNSAVFSFAKPKIIVISDGPIKYDSQLVDYRQHATGITIGGNTRRVLTTRKDGAIYFEDSGIIPARLGATNWDMDVIF